MKTGQLHEGFAAHSDDKQASEKSLGVVFGCVCAIVAALRWYHEHGFIWWLAAAGVFFLLAYGWQAPLRPLNRIWQKLGALLFCVTNPLLMGLVFYLAVVPTGLVMRALGRDPLRMKLDPAADSYWISRATPGPAGHDMKNQF